MNFQLVGLIKLPQIITANPFALLRAAKPRFINFSSQKFIMVKAIRKVLAQNPSVVFAYLYGSSTDVGA